MYKLFTERVIAGKNVDVPMGEFPTLDSATNFLYGAGFFLSAYCIDENNERLELIETEYFDQDVGCDCVKLSFRKEL